MSPHFLRVWGETEEFSGCPFDVSLRSLCGCNELLGPSGCLSPVTSVQTNQGSTMVCSNIDVDVYSVLFIWMVLQDFCYQSPTFLKAGLKTNLWAPKVSDDRQWFKVG